jgi:hypothetical protein
MTANAILPHCEGLRCEQAGGNGARCPGEGRGSRSSPDSCARRARSNRISCTIQRSPCLLSLLLLLPKSPFRLCRRLPQGALYVPGWVLQAYQRSLKWSRIEPLCYRGMGLSCRPVSNTRTFADCMSGSLPHCKRCVHSYLASYEPERRPRRNSWRQAARRGRTPLSQRGTHRETQLDERVRHRRHGRRRKEPSTKERTSRPWSAASGLPRLRSWLACSRLSGARRTASPATLAPSGRWSPSGAGESCSAHLPPLPFPS